MYYSYDFKYKSLLVFTKAKDHAIALLKKQKENYKILSPLVTDDSDLYHIKISIIQTRRFITFMSTIEKDKLFTRESIDLWREAMKAQPIFLDFLSHFKLKSQNKEQKSSGNNLLRTALLNNYKLKLEQAHSAENDLVNREIVTVSAAEIENVQLKLQKLKYN